MTRARLPDRRPSARDGLTAARRHDHGPSGVRALIIGFALLTLAGCASFTVADTTPLPPDRLLPLGSDRISSGGYRLASMMPSEAAPDLLVLIAMSGGGKRSASFSYGALTGMRELMVPTREGPRPLLGEIDGITGVSGGSFTAAYYGLHRDDTFTHYKEDFLYQDTNAFIFGVYLLPWNWTWLIDPTVGTNDFMERVYDRTMFHGATFADLQKLGRPVIGISATDLSYGTPFLMTQDSFDLICSDLEPFPVARAVAASNGFPGLFSPVTLTNRAAQCGGRKPGWLTNFPESERHNPLSRLNVERISADRYLDPEQTKYLHLVDGGVSDNLAMRAVGSATQTIGRTDAGMRSARLDQLRRILVISVDGQSAQDSSIARQRVVGGLFSLFGLVSGGQIDRFNFETMYTFSQQLKDLVAAVSHARCAETPVINGARCDDVQGELVQVSLSARPSGPETDRLLSIPTGLTLSQENVDLLVAAGHDATVGSQSLRAFLENYPPQPAATGTTVAAVSK